MLKPVQRLLNTKIAAANSSETSVTFNKRHGVTLQKTLISVSTAAWTSSDVRKKASSLACWLAFLLRTEFDNLVTMWSRDPLAIWSANFANICAFLMILHENENISLKSINLFGLRGSVRWVPDICTSFRWKQVSVEWARSADSKLPWRRLFQWCHSNKKKHVRDRGTCRRQRWLQIINGHHHKQQQQPSGFLEAVYLLTICGWTWQSVGPPSPANPHCVVRCGHESRAREDEEIPQRLILIFIIFAAKTRIRRDKFSNRRANTSSQIGRVKAILLQ